MIYQELNARADCGINEINEECSKWLLWSTHNTYRERDRTVNTEVRNSSYKESYQTA